MGRFIRYHLVEMPELWANIPIFNLVGSTRQIQALLELTISYRINPYSQTDRYHSK